jgi:micrococcal nuclease
MYEYKCQLIRVVDGDTIDVLIDVGFSTYKKERIRLYGINTPECRTRNKAEKILGFAAKARLKEILKEFGKNFIVKTEIDKKGKYGRILGQLYDLEMQNCANDMMVVEGHAEEYYGGAR